MQIKLPSTTMMHHTIYFIQGIGEIKIEGKKYIIEDGDLILLKPSELYHCVVKDGTYHERLVLYFNGSLLGNFGEIGDTFLEPFYKRQDGYGNKISSEIIKAHGIDVEIEQLLAITKNQNDINQILSVCKLIEILAKMGTVISNELSQSSYQIRENPLVNDIIAYINKNFSRDISLDNISKEFYRDKYYISHLFKEEVGVTLWNYVIFRRLTAFNDLIQTDLPIEEAAFRVGFQNYSNFYKLYKKHMQMTPAQFKKSQTRK